MTITLTNRAVLYLRSVIEAPGWCKTNADIFRGGQLLCETLPDCKEAPELKPTKTDVGLTIKPEDQKAFDAWADMSVSIDLSDPLTETVRKALNHFTTEGKLTPGAATFELFKAFNLKPE